MHGAAPRIPGHTLQPDTPCGAWEASRRDPSRPQLPPDDAAQIFPQSAPKPGTRHRGRSRARGRTRSGKTPCPCSTRIVHEHARPPHRQGDAGRFVPKAALRADARWRRRGGATHVPPAQLFKVRGTRRRRGRRGCLETAPGQLPRRPAEAGLPARPFLARSPRMSWPAGRRCGSSVKPQRLHVAHRLRTAPSHAARRL